MKSRMLSLLFFLCLGTAALLHSPEPEIPDKTTYDADIHVADIVGVEFNQVDMAEFQFAKGGLECKNAFYSVAHAPELNWGLKLSDAKETAINLTKWDNPNNWKNPDEYIDKRIDPGICKLSASRVHYN